MKIVIDADIPYISGVFEPFARVFYMKGGEITNSSILDADALIVRTRTCCDRNLLEGSRVKMIASATIGFDHIDMDYCAQSGIKVSTAPGSNSRGVLQWVGAVLVYLSHKYDWRPEQIKIGVVGVGHVGSKVARYSQHWGFEVRCCDPPRQRAGEVAPAGEQFVGLEQIVSWADIITFHTPLTHTGEDATYHLADASFFSNLRKGATIINSSRGEVVDTTALVDALRKGLCRAVIDTWEQEPNIEKELLKIADLATPHVAGYSSQGKANATLMVVRAVAEQFNLPLKTWHPEEMSLIAYGLSNQRISWSEIDNTIARYYDIEAESDALKSAPEEFESFRNSYPLRKEYF